MNKKTKTIIIFLISVIFGSLGYANTPKANHEKTTPKIDPNKFYVVKKIADGDTFTVQVGKEKVSVRMIGVDTPETVDPRKTVQCFGKEASDKTKELLLNHFVKLIPDSTQNISDKYNRVLAYVYRDDGLFINKDLIENGYAHEYTYKVPYEKQKEFKQLEKSAREAKVGLWGSLCEEKIK